MLDGGLRVAGAWTIRREPWILCIAGAIAFALLPLWVGDLGLSWDALNHHIYLGWTAEHPRFDQDYLAASYQAYQYPYLYWPVYRLAMAGVHGATAGMVLALLHATAIPAVWLLARACIPGRDGFATGMRAAAVFLAFFSTGILSLFDATSNDLMAGIPLLWAYAFALQPVAEPGRPVMRAAVMSGALAGMAVAFKMSNGPLAIVLPLLWAWPAGSVAARAGRCLAAGLAVLACFGTFYGYWGWQLWSHFGNPIYPLYDHWFEPLRMVTQWHR
jgi:hypothetical protein